MSLISIRKIIMNRRELTSEALHGAITPAEAKSLQLEAVTKPTSVRRIELVKPILDEYERMRKEIPHREPRLVRHGHFRLSLWVRPNFHQQIFELRFL